MFRFLISAAFSAVALIKERRLLEGSAYSDLTVNAAALIKRQDLSEAWRLLEKMRYLYLIFLRQISSYLNQQKQLLIKSTFFSNVDVLHPLFFHMNFYF